MKQHWIWLEWSFPPLISINIKERRFANIQTGKQIARQCEDGVGCTYEEGVADNDLRPVRWQAAVLPTVLLEEILLRSWFWAVGL